jgi:hypothetical protein
MNEFNLQCAIQSRLQPGSCRESLTKDSEAVSLNRQ